MKFLASNIIILLFYSVLGVVLFEGLKVSVPLSNEVMDQFKLDSAAGAFTGISIGVWLLLINWDWGRKSLLGKEIWNVVTGYLDSIPKIMSVLLGLVLMVFLDEGKMGGVLIKLFALLVLFAFLNWIGKRLFHPFVLHSWKIMLWRKKLLKIIRLP